MLSLTLPSCKPLIRRDSGQLYRRGQRRALHHIVSQTPYQLEQAPLTRASDPLRQSLNISAKEKVLQLIGQGYDNYNPGELGPAITELLVSCPIAKDQLATQSFQIGQGTWQVFYAPHISGMSSVLGTKFTIQYKLAGSSLWSYVKYSNPVLGSGWLNAAGSMSRKYDDTVEIKFDRFWIDGPNSLRSDIPESQSSTSIDSIIGVLGRGAFFPQFAVFPVLYLDNDVCVFEFPPLNSQIAVRRVVE